jgi:hypothetical protein
MPASISHEGYSAKPMHSYWDDFWEAKGYDAAIDLAHSLGKDDDAKRLAIQRDEFVHDVAASLRVATATQRIGYLPGSAELGDFDPTSTSIAFAPGSRFPDLPAAMVAATYERYWSEFVARRDVPSTLGEYTPYELRTVGTFIRLGWRERAQELLRFFMADRRPAAWNQWAEVVGRDARQPRFVGDMPHGWIASDYIRSLLDVFAFERHGDHSIAIAAGVPPAWLAGTGVRIARLRTPYGDLSYSLQATAKRIELNIAGGMRVPPGGFVFAWPGATPPPLARVNGKVTQWQNSELHIAELPARVLIEGHLE